MAERIDWIALTIFLFFFALVTVMGFFAARWKSGPVSAHLDAGISLGGSSYTFYVGLGALILNIAVAVLATLVLSRISPDRRGVTAPS
jgi:hypothetical protein